MIVRNLERFPVRAVLTTLGLAASLALLVGAQFLFDSLDRVVDQPTTAPSAGARPSASPSRATSRRSRELARLPGVFAAEPVRVGGRSPQGPAGAKRLTRIVGLRPGRACCTGRSTPSDRVRRRSRTRAGARARRWRRGWRCEPATVSGSRCSTGAAPGPACRSPAWPATTAASTAYMDRRELNRLMGEGDVASGAAAAGRRRPRAEPSTAPSRPTPQIVGASSRDETVAAWRRPWPRPSR